MQHWRIKLSLFLNYFVFAILLNSSGIAILQVQNSFGISKSAAAWIDPCKDISIAVLSFLVSSYIARIGYKRAMLVGLGLTALVCFVIPSVPGFLAVKLMFVAIGSCFALIKMSVYSTLGIITADSKAHISLMNFIESFFMVGNLSLYFLFSYFTDSAHPESVSWLKTYYVLGVLATLAFILLLGASLDESAAKPETEKPFMEAFGEMFKLMVKPVVLTFIASAFLYVLIEQSIQNFLPTYNNKELMLPAALSIQMAGILAASTAAGRFLAGILLKKLKWFPVLAGCLVLAAVLVLTAIPLAKDAVGKTYTGWGDAPLAAYIFPLIGLILAPIYPAINSVILSSLPRHMHGLMSGLIIIFSALGGTTGSLLTGYIFEKYNGQAAFYFSLVPITLLVICLTLFSRFRPGTRTV